MNRKGTIDIRRVNTPARQRRVASRLRTLRRRSVRAARSVWNGENRLIKVAPLSPTNNAKRLEFKYDAQGRRITKDVYVYDSSQSLWSKAQSHSFVYDQWNLIADIETNPQSEIVNRKCYTWGLDLSGTLQGAGGVGGLLSVTVLTNSTAATFLTTYDANGNIAEYVSTNGTLAAHFEYDPYGNITQASGLMPQAFSHRFSTKYWDPETSLYYYGYRYYSPELGRWLNRDPIEEWGGFNLFRFAKNNPVRFYDFLGLDDDNCGCDSEGKKIEKQMDDAGASCCPSKMSTIDINHEFGLIGHTWLDFNSNGESLGYQPTDSQRTVEGICNYIQSNPVPGEWRDDSGRNGDEDTTTTYKACPESEQKVRDYINANQSGQWEGHNVGAPNCTGAAGSALTAGGFNPGFDPNSEIDPNHFGPSRIDDFALIPDDDVLP